MITNCENESDRLSGRILDLIKREIMKEENKSKLKTSVDGLCFYVISTIQPYLLIVLVLLMVIIVSQFYLLRKLNSFSI